MMWSTARLTTYIGGALAGMAFLAATLGAGTYDAATGTFDLHPFNVWWLAGIIAAPVGSAMAAVVLTVQRARK
jgi:hypothetical protein